MSDAQFSSLSPNSSNDLSNRYNEDNDLNDQETLSIISNIDEKNIANLDDFDDLYDKIKPTDPFLSDFMKEECEDNVYSVEAIKSSQFYDSLVEQNFTESNDLNCFFNGTQSENELNEYLINDGDYIDDIPSDILEYHDPSPISASLDGKVIPNSNSNKRPFINQENCNFYTSEVPIKQRKIEISPQSRCHEWINKLKKTPDNTCFKASGLLDRRKTKHHQILNDQESDFYEENTVNSKEQKSNSIDKKSISNNFSSISVKFTSIKKPLSISIIANRNSHFRTISSNRNSSKKNYPSNNETTITDRQNNPSSFPVSSNNSQLVNSSNSTRTVSDVIDISRIPEPLRMGKRVSRRGQRFSLWQFLMCLLDSSRYKEHSTGIRWIHRNCGVFHIIDSKQVATLWGQYKERRDKMTYDSLARSLRHYYKKNLMAKINNRRLVYQIAQECLQWSSETFIKRNRD